ncbi:DEAD/DEAH box helicase [Belliella pelovolcani]|uniref:Superfamily II DNA and RNA helicase n=1 Tax=Belliella pelovolcani TaxID=529505 RepID=A0A1N7LQW4_9BACT|nr:DEAD/DEAH box helicase [Belliella pelovolcani]SIS76226.1 Superfamily II DNA and RNA helicase [Belliella pelovolcani]
MNFDSFKFEASLQDGLDAMGFDKPTPVQEKAIPIILEGKDIIACAQTGTGKTAAFILPVLNKIAKSGGNKLNTLVLAPTRELAIQIDQQIQGFAYFLGISSIPIYGGGDGVVWEQQKRALEEGAEIVVATPGRLIALLAGGKIKLDSLEHLILDEADRMLDMGFSDDLLTIVNYLPKDRQTILFSATMPPKIRSFSKKLLKNPEEVTLSVGKTAEGVTQGAYLVHDPQKEDLVRHILRQKEYEAVIIFASTKDKVKSLYKVLKKDFEVEAFHSDLEQVEREQIMSRFKNRSLKILIGTDIISRGIDVVGIELVINFDTPNDPEDYVHRVGRTARADSKGEAITFINDKDRYKFNRIEALIGMEVDKLPLPEGYPMGPSYSNGSSNKKQGSGSKKGGKSHEKPRGNFSKSTHTEKPTRKPRQNPQEAHVVRDPENPDTPSGFKPRQNPKVDKSPEFQERPKTSKFGSRKNVID